MSLTNRGAWISHSWVYYEPRPGSNRRECVFETTFKMQKYFGYVYSPEEALESWVANFLGLYAVAPLALIRGLGRADLLRKYGLPVPR